VVTLSARADSALRSGHWDCLIAGADGIPAGHQCRARWRALSLLREVEELHALFGKGIDARSRSTA
jgi:hypothetical protein